MIDENGVVSNCLTILKVRQVTLWKLGYLKRRIGNRMAQKRGYNFDSVRE